MAHLQVTTTVASRADADRLAHDLVEARLAACVQVLGPVRSTYRWRGAVESADEWMCLVKTTDERYAELAGRVRELHGYETPEITAVPIGPGDADYLAWIDAETRD